MRFHVRHVTRYDYDRPVPLGAMTVRLRPRDDGTQHLERYRIETDPAPAGRADLIDAEGIPVTRFWFDDPAGTLTIESEIEARAIRDNPYDWIMDPDACVAPMRYGKAEAATLVRERAFGGDAAAEALAKEILTEAGGSAPAFLALLTKRIADVVVHERRSEGPPRSPSETLAGGRGACRDVAVAFMETSRAAGFAARFVSGYTVPDEDFPGELHAWAEVYLPDGGWRGYDATGGIAVADGHLAVASAAHPAQCAPVEGTFGAGASSRLTTTVEIDATP